MIRRPPRSTLFSLHDALPISWGKEAVEARLASLCAQAEDAVRAGYSIIVISDRLVERERVAIPALLALSRSEEHTSELQSLAYLVCRLLLEKKIRAYSLSNYT